VERETHTIHPSKDLQEIRRELSGRPEKDRGYDPTTGITGRTLVSTYWAKWLDKTRGTKDK